MEADVPLDSIAVMGDWKSDAMYLYYALFAAHSIIFGLVYFFSNFLFTFFTSSSGFGPFIFILTLCLLQILPCIFTNLYSERTVIPNWNINVSFSCV